MLGSIIGAIGNVIGGAIGAGSANNQADANTAMQREFAQNGISWKVQDAKNAGLHPLYALGGSGAAYAPNPIVTNDGGVSEAMNNLGQGITRAKQAQQTTEQKQLFDAQIGLIHAQTNEANARAMQATIQPPGMHTATGTTTQPYFPSGNDYGVITGYPLPPKALDGAMGKVATKINSGQVKVKPDEPISSRPNDRSTTAADAHPFWSEFHLADGRKATLPKSFSDDIDIPITLLPTVIAENVRRYGLRHTLNNASGGLYEDFNRGVHKYVVDRDWSPTGKFYKERR